MNKISAKEYVDHFQDPAFVNDLNRRVLAVNEAYLDFFGLSSVEEVEGLRWKELLSPQDYDRYTRAYQKFCSSPSSDCFEEKVWVKTPGGDRCIAVFVRRTPPVVEGPTKGFCGSFLDITQVEEVLDAVVRAQKNLE